MTVDLDELERLAQAATQAKWTATDITEDHIDESIARLYPEEHGDDCEGHAEYEAWWLTGPAFVKLDDGTALTKADAAHIAANDPPAVLALVRELRAAREVVLHARQAAANLYVAHGVPLLALSDALAEYDRAGRDPEPGR